MLGILWNLISISSSFLDRELEKGPKLRQLWELQDPYSITVHLGGPVGGDLGFHINKSSCELPALARDLRPTRGAKVGQPHERGGWGASSLGPTVHRVELRSITSQGHCLNSLWEAEPQFPLHTLSPTLSFPPSSLSPPLSFPPLPTSFCPLHLLSSLLPQSSPDPCSSLSPLLFLLLLLFSSFLLPHPFLFPLSLQVQWNRSNSSVDSKRIQG